MKPWELIDSAAVPDGSGTLRLMRRGHELVIQIDGHELMRSTVHGSEDALAELTCDRLANRQRSRILIGGLGMGFTLAAALRALGRDAQVVVAELVPAVVRWNRGLLGDVAGHPLADSRVAVYDGDVDDLIRKSSAPWDAILLDVDNGPTGLTRAANDRLYSSQGLDRAFRALKPQGILSVWSAAPARDFTRRLARAGFAVETIALRARGRKGGPRFLMWLGIRKAEGPRWQRGA
jgi:spermidine synthase